MDNVVYLEQRRHPRREVRWDASLSTPTSTIVGTIVNSSIGGICFVAEHAFIDGDLYSGDEILDLLEEGGQMELVIEKAVSQLAEICWLNGTRLGLQYIGQVRMAA